MRLHILGICGTFMAGIALIAKQKNFDITGSDAHIYPPMSTLLASHNIPIFEGYDVKNLYPHPDLIIMGNSMTRGNPCVEYVLNQNIPYMSGPQWLAAHVLRNYHVLAVSGTHGKTTVSSLLSWILAVAGLNPGFLIGGLAKNFDHSACLGEGDFFVIEADEYDTAFFDKRSKFIHYHPKTLILNNLEFDHADIFPNLDAIKMQFSYLLRTVPSQGLIICPQSDRNIQQVLSQGYWTPIEYTGNEKNKGVIWHTALLKADASQFEIYYKNSKQGEVHWSLIGEHNAANAISAVAAAHHVGVHPQKAIAALNQFQGIKRRLEIYKKINGITLYDDFAHHPTAIAATLSGLRKKIGKKRLLVILECGTHTMRSNRHQKTLGPSLQEADKLWLLWPKQNRNNNILQNISVPLSLCDSVDEIVQEVIKVTQTSDHIVIMSNRGFDNIHKKLAQALAA
ncbi:UDP-N-acetylmuramate:L-alanyl-gamma-D-glutamyl-meso-diaminopimelate ligase [Rickettsiella grylli]|uniref:UDP-N-acetylmuramate:L-alanyl-gamma-D-glutamyl- meso-diaminopimelate ligase n=1 Tax=Rickettsiella grylli TaxID=59196 RepID=UPI0008FCF7EF|nr:UDP-N-acetylmuramate:L-alanyl-gamma-D-glutamyl-meso-diaminopimelate ligase [Rickettsiella grylli]OJA00258.1 UDP-N-acetylmuramate:L-alanyl-gamma-D-glutamyl-meso-diaminopimelate ligase [Rickettsiella grylli]